MSQSLEQLAGVKALVLGDLMLDRYLHGNVKRISPEAPVPVVTISGEVHGLGGSGNVAAGMAALGAKVTVQGVIGDDADGRELLHLLHSLSVQTTFLRQSTKTETVAKSRVVAGKFQQLLRLDRDGSAAARAEEALRGLPDLLKAVPEFDVIVLADYEKGSLPEELVRQVIATAKAQGVPCTVDPKKVDFSVYAGATLLTPNLLEAERALGKVAETVFDLETEAAALRKSLQLKHLVVTRGSEGMTVIDDQGVKHVPADVHEVADVSGAGDTVTSVLALCMARGWPVYEACRLASAAAGIAVSKPRTYVVKSAELARRWEGGSVKVMDWEAAGDYLAGAHRAGRQIVFTNGCFDVLHSGHLFCLERARALGDLLVVGLNSDASIRQLKGPGRPVVSQQHRAVLLAGLACVDLVVVFEEETPEALIHLVKPDVLVKGGDYDVASIVGADFVRGYGGRVVTVPLVEGLSTTNILRSLGDA